MWCAGAGRGLRAVTSWFEESRELAVRGGLHGGNGARAVPLRKLYVMSVNVRAGAFGKGVFKGRVRSSRKRGHCGRSTRARDTRRPWTACHEQSWVGQGLEKFLLSRFASQRWVSI